MKLYRLKFYNVMIEINFALFYLYSQKFYNQLFVFFLNIASHIWIHYQKKFRHD